MKRKTASTARMKLPWSPIPRPSDQVIYYNTSLAITGQLIGHTPWGKPLVRNMFGRDAELESFEFIRVIDHGSRVNPNWNRLPPNANVYKPTKIELSQFEKILGGTLYPGPTYLEVINEIWARGFEIFVVGGTVRDAIQNRISRDVDLATTMPLTMMTAPILKSMFQRSSISQEDIVSGHARLGGALGTTEPSLDLVVFKHSMPANSEAVFCDDFNKDIKYRDFACNAVYFDPINKVLIDPSGFGIQDAEEKNLRFVCDFNSITPYQRATIIFRFFRFIEMGYSPLDQCLTTIQSMVFPTLSAIGGIQICDCLRKHLLGRFPKQEHRERLNQLHTVLVQIDVEAVWNELIEPFLPEILDATI